MNKEAGVEIHLDRLEAMQCEQCGAALDVAALEPFSSIVCPSCGNQDIVPARLGDFLLLNLISTGGMGGVYRARDESLGRLVAIKVMLKKLGDDLDFVERFKREAQAAAKLNHPNVAQIYSYGQEAGQPFIVMELVSGHRFDRMIESYPEGIDPETVLRVGVDIAEGLKAADEIGLIHGDIKPENILLDEKRKAKLVDFGIASSVDQAASEGIWGTPYYIAPEKVRRRRSDARSDIYSLGATLYHALCGQPPFEGETPLDVVKARLTADPVPLVEVREGFSKSLSDCVARMLQREPAHRYPTYASLLSDFRRELEALGTHNGSAARVTGKRVVIKRRETAETTPGHPTTHVVVPRAPHADTFQAAALRHLAPTDRELHAARAKQRGRRVAGIVSLLVALTVIGAVLIVMRYQERKRTRIVMALRAHERDEAIKEVSIIYPEIEQAASNVFERVAEFEAMRTHVGEVDRYLDSVVPAEVRARPRPRPAARRDRAEPARARPRAAPRVDEMGREAPFGTAPHEELVRITQAEPEPPAVDAEEPEPEVAPVQGAPTFAMPAREIRKKSDRLRDLADAARSDGERLGPIVNLAGALHDSLRTAGAVEDVRRKEKELRDHRTVVDLILGGITDAAVEGSALVADIDRLAEGIREEVEARRLAEERRRAEEAHLALIATEQQRVIDVRASATELVLQADYTGALALVQREAAKLQTEEAGAALRIVEERLELLIELQAFVIEGLAREKYAWGWQRTGAEREDVLGADADGVMLRGRTVPWKEVSNAQFLAFVEHLIADPQIRQSQRGRLLLGAGIFCEQHGGDAPARTYRERALDAAPHLDEDARRLLP
jgi:hypothetical protein